MYLGEFDVIIETSEFKDFTPADWAMYFIERYGQIDGAHHKQWVLDQTMRILKGTPVIVKVARWANGETEYRVWTSEDVSQDYVNWVYSMLGERDEITGETEYTYDEGIAP